MDYFFLFVGSIILILALMVYLKYKKSVQKLNLSAALYAQLRWPKTKTCSQESIVP